MPKPPNQAYPLSSATKLLPYLTGLYKVLHMGRFESEGQTGMFLELDQFPHLAVLCGVPHIHTCHVVHESCGNLFGHYHLEWLMFDTSVAPVSSTRLEEMELHQRGQLQSVLDISQF